MAKRALTTDAQDYLETLGFEATAYRERNLGPRLVVVAKDIEDTGPALSLLEKMLEATKIPSHNIRIIDLKNYSDDSVAKADVVLLMGAESAQKVLQSESSIEDLRGSIKNKMLVTFHPSDCLQKPELKKPVWEDLQKIMRELA